MHLWAVYRDLNHGDCIMQFPIQELPLGLEKIIIMNDYYNSKSLHSSNITFDGAEKVIVDKFELSSAATYFESCSASDQPSFND